MGRIIGQAIGGIVLFFTVWFCLAQFDWMKILKVQQVTETTEKKLGDLFWEYYSKNETIVELAEVINPIDTLLSRICKSNDLDKSKIILHIVKNDLSNAFALPDGHLVLYTGLIRETENESQLSGVICHEIAHIELDHIMKKLVKEVGLSIILTTTTGAGGTEMIKEMAKLLSSSAYDRSLEKDADLKAVDYMSKSNLDAKEFANLLFTMSLDESAFQSNLSWISTHPNTEGRSEYILKYGKEKHTKVHAILHKSTWSTLQSSL